MGRRTLLRTCRVLQSLPPGWLLKLPIQTTQDSYDQRVWKNRFRRSYRHNRTQVFGYSGRSAKENFEGSRKSDLANSIDYSPWAPREGRSCSF